MKLPVPVSEQEFGWWVVTGPRTGQYIVCRCRCGIEKPVRISYLYGSRSTKCFSCARKEVNKTRNASAKLLPEVRFWQMVNKAGPILYKHLGMCWQWLGKPMESGYGQINIGNRKMVRAHRYSWFLHHGEMPQLCVLHRCDNTLCVNPNHLFLGTVQDNIADRDAKGRQAKGNRSGRYTHPECTASGERHGRYGNPHQTGIGEDNGNARLTEVQVLDILMSYVPNSRECGQPALARKHGVNQTLVSGIVRGDNWKRVHESWVSNGCPKLALAK